MLQGMLFNYSWKIVKGPAGIITCVYNISTANIVFF